MCESRLLYRHQGLPLVKRQVAESNHVMFIDECTGA